MHLVYSVQQKYKNSIFLRLWFFFASKCNKTFSWNCFHFSRVQKTVVKKSQFKLTEAQLWHFPIGLGIMTFNVGYSRGWDIFVCNKNKSFPTYMYFDHDQKCFMKFHVPCCRRQKIISAQCLRGFFFCFLNSILIKNIFKEATLHKRNMPWYISL